MRIHELRLEDLRDVDFDPVAAMVVQANQVQVRVLPRRDRWAASQVGTVLASALTRAGLVARKEVGDGSVGTTLVEPLVEPNSADTGGRSWTPVDIGGGQIPGWTAVDF